MPPNLRSVIAHATRGGRSFLSGRNLPSSPIISDETAAWAKNYGRVACFLFGYGSYTAWHLVQIREYHYTLMKAVDKEHKELWQQMIRNHNLKYFRNR